MEREDIKINKDLADVYVQWGKEHPVDLGLGWGQEPWSQAEMPVTEELVHEAADKSEAAIVIIGRTAGEEKDITLEEGAYSLTKQNMR